jgi:hypothetical protein
MPVDLSIAAQRALANANADDTVQLPSLAQSIYPHLRVNEAKHSAQSGVRPATIASAVYPHLVKKET